MELALYHDLVPWYQLLDPLEDHRAECEELRRAFESVLGPGRHSLFELGAGAGNNLYFLKQTFDCTASDLSAEMLELSRKLNPGCEHVTGDMRTLRLGRTFDAVLVHDAICYMANRADLRAAMITAFAHTRPGGAAIFAPDTFRDIFEEYCEVHEGEDGERALRCLEWSWDPDPSDETCTVDYAFLLREGRSLRAVHDRHVEGLFSKETWIELARQVGYEVQLWPRELDAEVAGRGYAEQVLLCKRPLGT